MTKGSLHKDRKAPREDSTKMSPCASLKSRVEKEEPGYVLRSCLSRKNADQFAVKSQRKTPVDNSGDFKSRLKSPPQSYQISAFKTRRNIHYMVKAELFLMVKNTLTYYVTSVKAT